MALRWTLRSPGVAPRDPGSSGAFSSWRSPVEALRALDRLLGLWESRARSRRQLSGLDDAQLKDIGVSRADARREARKPFWRA